MEKTAITISKPSIARQLLKMDKGYRIIDIKPSKHDPRRTVFVFENVYGLMVDVDYLRKKPEQEQVEQLLPI